MQVHLSLHPWLLGSSDLCLVLACGLQAPVSLAFLPASHSPCFPVMSSPRAFAQTALCSPSLHPSPVPAHATLVYVHPEATMPGSAISLGEWGRHAPHVPSFGDPELPLSVCRWLRHASLLSADWSGCSSTRGRPHGPDPTSQWTQHPLRRSRMWGGCGRPCWMRGGHSLSGTVPCLPCAMWVARRRPWPWLKVRLDPSLGPG